LPSPILQIAHGQRTLIRLSRGLFFVSRITPRSGEIFDDSDDHEIENLT